MASATQGLSPTMLDRDAAAVAPRLAAKNVTMRYAWRSALDDVSFELRAGELFGILGPNGSGKSTLMRCLTGLIRPTVGTFWLDGKPIEPADRALRASMGVVFQEPSLDPKLTCAENLRLGAELFAVPRADAKERARELLAFMELADRADEPVHTLSGGLKRRLEIARALIPRPSLLVLDEPTTGLDQAAFVRTWRLLMGLKRAQGLTILVSTHRVEEAEQCDRLVVLDRGRVVECDTPARLLERVAGDVLTIETEHPNTMAEDLREHFGAIVHVTEDAVVAEHREGHLLVPRIVESFPAGTIRSISMRRPTLADAFLKLTGRTLEEAEREQGDRS